MMSHPISLRLRRLLAVPLAVALAACGGADAGAGEAATPEDVDTQAAAEVTEAELAAFRAPADSVLTPEQVDRYLRTSLLQFDLVRKEAATLHQQAQEMEARAQEGGLIAGLRNVAAAGGLVMGWTDLVGGSYVRSARTLGYNPAEMEWVRDRMAEVGGQAVQDHFQAQAAQGAAKIGEQVAEMRRQLEAGELGGMTREQMEEQIRQMESLAAGIGPQELAAGATAANLEALRRARSAVTDEMWLAIGTAGGATGLAAWGALADPNDPEMQRRMDEIRALYQAALENRPLDGDRGGNGAAVSANNDEN